MHLIAHLFLAIWLGQRTPTAAEIVVDLSGFTGTLGEALVAVESGARYVCQWRFVDRRIVFSPISLVHPGELPAPDWDDGKDVTAALLWHLGCPPEVAARVFRCSAPIWFTPREKPRFTPRAGAVGLGVMLLAELVACYFLWDHQRAALTLTTEDALRQAAILGGFVLLPFAAVILWIVGAYLPPSPLGWMGSLVAIVLAGVPPVVTSLRTSSALWDDIERIGGGLAPLDLDTPDRSAGFSAADPETPEVPTPDRVRSWRLSENVHPSEVPRYTSVDKGVLVAWNAEICKIDRLTVLLDPARRAERVPEVRWIAYIARPQAQSAFRGWPTIEWINLRIVDVPSGKMVAHGTAWRTPLSPSDGGVAQRDVLLLVEEAIAASYVRSGG